MKWFNDPNYRWMKNRITSMKKDWETALLSLNKKRPLTKLKKKKVFTYSGESYKRSLIMDTLEMLFSRTVAAFFHFPPREDRYRTSQMSSLSKP